MEILFSKTAFEPEELDELKSVYEHITSERWFSPSPNAKKAFALHLINTFPSSSFDPEEFRAQAESTAKRFYRHDQTAA
jgi:hypothetical protein